MLSETLEQLKKSATPVFLRDLSLELQAIASEDGVTDSETIVGFYIDFDDYYTD